MELFIQASPGLGSNYPGFMKQSNFLKRIALRDVAFRDAYINESDRLEELEDKLTMAQLVATRFASDEELAALIERAAKENLSPKAIKESIKNWTADENRV